MALKTCIFVTFIPTFYARTSNEWMIGWMDGWMDGWMNKWMDGWMDGWMNKWMDGWMDGWINGWMDGWMDGWMNDWMMDGWMNRWVKNLMTNRSAFEPWSSGLSTRCFLWCLLPAWHPDHRFERNPPFCILSVQLHAVYPFFQAGK